MRSNEFRIGNFYDHSGRVKKVTPIVIEALFKSARLWCKPIPLTEEWLLKFGFIKRYKDCYEFGKLILNDKFVMMDIDIHLELRYVHQLQNLYFTLTGEELTIK